MTNNIDWNNLTFVNIDEDDAFDDVKKWMPSSVGDFIIGEYLKTENGNGQGNNYIFHHLKDQDGQKFSILGCTTLNKKMESKKPGMILKITYCGTATSKNGNAYKRYAVLVAQESINELDADISE